MSVTNWLRRSSGLVVPATGFANLAGQMQPCPSGNCCGFEPIFCGDVYDGDWPDTLWVDYPAIPGCGFPWDSVQTLTFDISEHPPTGGNCLYYSPDTETGPFWLDVGISTLYPNPAFDLIAAYQPGGIYVWRMPITSLITTFNETVPWYGGNLGCDGTSTACLVYE